MRFTDDEAEAIESKRGRNKVELVIKLTKKAMERDMSVQSEIFVFEITKCVLAALHERNGATLPRDEEPLRDTAREKRQERDPIGSIVPGGLDLFCLGHPCSLTHRVKG